MMRSICLWAFVCCIPSYAFCGNPDREFDRAIINGAKVSMGIHVIDDDGVPVDKAEVHVLLGMNFREKANFARGIADAISKKQHLDPSDESRILNYLVVPEIYVDGAVVSVALSERRLWSPEDPFLYDVAYEIVGAGGKVVDAGQPERGSAKLTSNPWSIIDPGPTEKWGAGKNKSMIVHVDAADGCVELRRKMFFSVGKAADAGSR